MARSPGFGALLASICAITSTTFAQDGPQSPAKSYPKSISLSYEILGASDTSIHPLVTVDYDPRTGEHVMPSWSPPLSELDKLKSTTPEPTSAPLVRILLPNGSSSVTSLTSFDPSLSQDINIWISPDGTALSASVGSRVPPPLSAEEEELRKKEERLRKRGKSVPPRPKPTKSKSKKAKEVVVGETQAGPAVVVNLNIARPGPQPKWNVRAAPQVDAEGREIEPEQLQEKTFFQKYWYILLAVAFLLMSGGGGGDK